MKQRILQELYRKLNVLRISRNQREILEACKSNKLIFLTPVPPPPLGGHVEHYYHFVFDLVLPLNTLLRNTPSNVVFVLEQFGIFTNRLQHLLPDRVRVQDESTIPKDAKRMQLMGMNPFWVQLTRKAIETFSYDICSRLEIDQTGNNDKILLIERLPPDRYFVEEAKVKGAGSFRRSILNHDDLKTTLRSMVREPFVFHNLQLEKIPFREQVDYFSKAKVVIAQHGASLVNCIWMKPNSVVVELSSDKYFNHFALISKLKNHSYHLYRLPDSHSEVDLDSFANWISGDVKLRRFLSL